MKYIILLLLAFSTCLAQEHNDTVTDSLKVDIEKMKYSIDILQQNAPWIVVLVTTIVALITSIMAARSKQTIDRLKISKKVKKKIAEERYDIYTKIITYIESWHAIKSEADFVLKCTDENEYNILEMNIFEHRLTSQIEIAEEIKEIAALTIYDHYLDKETYDCLMHLEKYLYNVNEYAKRENIKHFDFFIYTVYSDIYMFVWNISEQVRKYLASHDTLICMNSKNVPESDFKKIFKTTGFYCIYILNIENAKTEREKRNIKKLKSKNQFYRRMIQCKNEIKQCKENGFFKECKLFRELEDWDI